MKVAVGEEFDVMRRYWQSDDGRAQLVNTIEEGLKRARGGDYAFIIEGLTAKYAVNRRPCDLVTVGDQFGSRSYGFAVPKSMPLSELDALNTALLEMHEDGDIEVSSISVDSACMFEQMICVKRLLLRRFKASVVEESLTTKGSIFHVLGRRST